MILKDIELILSEKNSYCLLKNGTFLKVENIFVRNENIFIIERKLISKDSFFKFPCDPKKLDICIVDSLLETRIIVCYHEVEQKVVKYAIDANTSVLIPLLHSD